MKCPICAYDPLPGEAQFCPRCGQAVDVAARMDSAPAVGEKAKIQLEQQVEKNYGNVIGLRTEVVQGNVYGGDIYQVQVYVLDAAGRQAGKALPEPHGNPFLYLSAFTAKEWDLFFGREAAVRDVLDRIGAGRLLVLFGAAGVGKTSLLAAGVIPALIRGGALAVHVRDYSLPLADNLRAALRGSREKISIAVPEQGDLNSLVSHLLETTKGTLVLVLDQFERLFQGDLPQEQRAAQMQELVTCLANQPPEYFRVIAAVRDTSLVRLSDLQEAIPEFFRSFYELKPLSLDQARQVIDGSLGRAARPLFFDEGLLEQAVLPDLLNLSPHPEAGIHPPLLQIVFHQLYAVGSEKNPPLVRYEEYLQSWGGADGILARHLKNTLETALQGRQELAQQILVELAGRGLGAWVPASELPQPGEGTASTEAVLNALEEARLVELSQYEGDLRVTLTSQALADDILRTAGSDVVEADQHRKDLERVWAAWSAYGDLASLAQLRRLGAYRVQMNLHPLRALLLLRSAVTHGETVPVWLYALRTAESAALLRNIENYPLEGGRAASRHEVEKARRVLDLQAGMAEPAASPVERAYGELAACAVEFPMSAVRGSAALALLAAVGSRQALDRLRWAGLDRLSGWKRSIRLAESRAYIAEADPDLEVSRGELAGQLTWLVWAQRFRLRLWADRKRITMLMIGTMLGSGFVQAVLRFFIALVTGRTPGLFAFITFWYGAMLAAPLTFGFLAAGKMPALTRRQPPPAKPASNRQSLPGALLGGTGFGLLHLLIAFTAGSLSFQGKELLAVMGLAAGICLGLSLLPWRQRLETPLGKFRTPGFWLLLLAAIVFAAVQGVFIVLQQDFTSLVLTFPAAAYRSEISAQPAVYIGLALADAALSGAALAGGWLLGLRLGWQGFAAWRSLEDQG